MSSDSAKRGVQAFVIVSAAVFVGAAAFAFVVRGRPAAPILSAGPPAPGCPRRYLPRVPPRYETDGNPGHRAIWEADQEHSARQAGEYSGD